MAGFTRADMKAIFERGILLGFCAEHAADADAAETSKELVESCFEFSFRAVKDQKTKKADSNVVDTAKILEAWDKAGRPKGGGGFVELLLDREATKVGK